MMCVFTVIHHMFSRIDHSNSDPHRNAVRVCACMFVDKYICMHVCVLLDRVRVKYGLGCGDEGAGADR